MTRFTKTEETVQYLGDVKYMLSLVSSFKRISSLIQHNNVIVVYSFVVAYWVLVLGLCMKYIFRYWYTCT